MMKECRRAGLLPRSAEGHGVHGIDADCREALKGLPFVAGAEHRQAAGQQVLEDLAPADAAMDLDVIAATIDPGAQGTAPFERAQHLALQGFSRGKRILSGPTRAEGFLKTGDVFVAHGVVVR